MIRLMKVIFKKKEFRDIVIDNLTIDKVYNVISKRMIIEIQDSKKYLYYVIMFDDDISRTVRADRFIHLEDFRNDKLKEYISIEGLEHLYYLKKSQKKAIFISGHFNNFELMAMQIEKVGIELAAIYRPLNNVFLNKTMEKIRTENICKNQIKKGRAGSREIIKNVKNGKSIAIMIDQRVREGEKVNLFNHLATTTTIPAQLIKKYNCELVPVYIERIKNNYFKMFVSKPIKINNKKTIIEITKFLNDLLERMILRNVDQWIWTHNRWKD